MSRRGLGKRGSMMLAVMVAGLVGWIYLAKRGETNPPVDAPASVLSAIPPGAMLIAVVDVKALRATALGQRLLGQSRSIAGLGEVRTLCGVDPLDSVEQLALAIPTATKLGGFGLFATGAFEQAQLLSCAELVVSKRGGKPVRAPRDGFGVLRDSSLALSSAELAVASGGPLILGEPAYVAAALAASRSPQADGHAAHATLRELVQPEAADSVVLATVVLSREQRGTLIDELRNQNMADSPFAAVTAAALSMRLDSQLRAHAVLQCERPAACKGIAEIVDAARRDEADTLAARAVGLTRVLEGLSIEAGPGAVHLRASIPVDEALALLRRVLALRKLGRQLDEPEPEPLPADAGIVVQAPGSTASAAATPSATAAPTVRAVPSAPPR